MDIYRCYVLDFGKKFCENFRMPRISADKRFIHKYFLIAISLNDLFKGSQRQKYENYFMSTNKCVVEHKNKKHLRHLAGDD